MRLKSLRASGKQYQLGHTGIFKAIPEFDIAEGIMRVTAVIVLICTIIALFLIMGIIL